MNLRIETLRGLACLLLVVYHVIGADPAHGLRVADGMLRWINDGLAYLRMPLFTFLSGLVYGLRPFTGDSRAFLQGKARRLLLPMLFVGTAFALLQAFTPGTNSSIGPWYLIHVQPVAHFWFVESLFWVFVGVWALERCQLMHSPAGMAAVLVLSGVVYLTILGVVWFGLKGAICLAPYFLVGLAVSRFQLTSRISSTGVGLKLALLALACMVGLGMPAPKPDQRTLLILVTGLALVLWTLSWGWTNSRLAHVGRYSYAIFLFHVFFTAATRIALEQLDVRDVGLHIFLGSLAGLVGPMLLERWISRFKFPALMLLGKPTRRSQRPGLPTDPALGTAVSAT